MPSKLDSIPTSYAECRRFLNGRQARSCGNNTLVRQGLSTTNDQPTYEIVLHWTPVITFFPNETLELRTNGYQTVTTKDRINRVIRSHGWTVFSKRYEWFLSHRIGENSAEYRFSDGFRISATH